MSDPNHTPGPWEYRVDGNCVVIEGKGADYVAHTENPETAADRLDIANARLIAAAPDLLAACKKVMTTCGSPSDWNGETREFLLAIEAAIAKAEGQ